MQTLFADAWPRFPKPREKQFLSAVLSFRLVKPAGEERPGPGRSGSNLQHGPLKTGGVSQVAGTQPMMALLDMPCV